MDFYFDNYEIRTRTHELLYGGSPKKIEPLIFNLLVFMLENPDRVLSRDELIHSVWKSPVISDSALSATICATRHAIGDSAKQQRYIKTVSGCGYRFIADFSRTKGGDSCVEGRSGANVSPHLFSHAKEVEETKPSSPVTSTADSESADSLPLPDQPSIAIMDFVDIGSSEKGSLLAYGITAEINAGLARLPHFFVIARASAASLSSLNLTATEVSRRLGVRYLVYGNTERLSNRMRITFSVINAIQDAEIWSEHLDRSLDDLPRVRDEITGAILIAIDSAIEQAEIDRAFLLPTEDLSAWENYYRGFWHINRTTLKDINTAQHFFKQALALDARFARAYAGLSYTHCSRKLLTLNDDDDDLEKSREYASHSIDLCNREPMAYISLGRAYSVAGKYNHANRVLDRGIQVNPGHAQCHLLKGFSAAAGTSGYTHALPHLDIAERLSPFDPMLFCLRTIRAVALADQEKYNAAVDMSLQATDCPNAYFSTYAIATACLQLAGQTEKAQQYAAKVLKLRPDFSLELLQLTHHLGNKSTITVLTHAMQSAGIPKLSASVN